MATRTLNSFDIRQDWPDKWGGSGTLVLTLSDTIVSEDGISYPKTANEGGPLSSLGHHWQSTITVVDSLATTAAVTGLINTDVSTPSHVATYNVYVYDSRGKMRERLNSKPYHLHESLNSNAPTFSWEQWVNAMEFSQFRGSTTFVADRATVQSMIDAILYQKASTSPAYGLTSLSVAAASASDPIAVGANDPAIGGFTLHTSKYVSLNAASAALTSLGGGTLVIDASTPVASNLTIPATTELQFAGQGILTGSGKTVAISGPLIAPVKQLWASGIIVLFTGNTSIPTFYPQWWGVVGDGVTDDTTAMQTFLDAMENGFRATLTPGLNIRNSGLSLSALKNFTLAGVSGGNLNQSGMATFSYRGTNGGTHIHCISCTGLTLENFRLNDRAGAAVTDGPDTAIWFDQDGSGSISSRNTLRNVVDENGPNRAGYQFLKIDNVSDTNNEQHILDNVSASSYGYGGGGFGHLVGSAVYIGHGNVKEVDIQNCAFLGFDKAIEVVGGSFYSFKNNYTACGVVFSGRLGDSCFSIGDHGEETTSLYDLTDSTCRLIIESARFDNLRGAQTPSANTSDDPVFRSRGHLIEIRGSQFTSYSANFDSSFIKSTDGAGATPGSGRLIWKHNTASISDADLITGLDTFNYSEDDARGGGLALRGAFSFPGENTAVLAGATPSVKFSDAGAQYTVRLRLGGDATPITNFVEGYEGQVIVLLGDGTRALVNGATIATLSGTSIIPANGSIVTFVKYGTVWRQQAGGYGLAKGEGAALTVSSNTITPTNEVHQVGAGLIKTITVPSTLTSGSVALIPTVAFTYDATGNILGTGTAVVGRTMFATYSASTGKWSMSY